MKKFTWCAFVLISALLTVAGCKKDSTPASTANYSPLTAGSTWTYQATTTPSGGAPSSGSYTLTATSRDTLVTGRNYRVLTSTTGTNSYRAKVGNDYWSFGSIATANIQIEQLYLKDNADVNATWQSTQGFQVPAFPIPLTATLIFTVKEKGITRVVNGTTFNNVIRVGLKVGISGVVGDVVDADFYHAPGVGMIENRYRVQNLAIAGVPDSETVEILTSYTIR